MSQIETKFFIKINHFKHRKIEQISDDYIIIALFDLKKQIIAIILIYKLVQAIQQIWHLQHKYNIYIFWTRYLKYL